MLCFSVANYSLLPTLRCNINSRQIRAFAEQHIIAIISVDMDGNPERITPRLLQSGVNLIYPMEIAAGSDFKQTVRQHPNLEVRLTALAVTTGFGPGTKVFDDRVEERDPPPIIREPYGALNRVRRTATRGVSSLIL